MHLFFPLVSSLSFLGSFASAASPSPASTPEYYERLLLRPLPFGSLLASFDFRSNTTFSGFESQNFRFFPRSLGQILQHAGTRELHLRFGLGRWDAESWGARPWNGTREGGTGVELWAWLEAESDEEADKKWRILTNALSGLFCASLNFIDSTRTTRPVMSFRPEGSSRYYDSTAGNMHLLHGVLPREVVCTENLTPFLKLLPCKGKAGISTLLDGHKLFDASWQSMAIDVRPLCPEDGAGGECVLQIEQTVDMVLDIERSKRPRDNPIPRPKPFYALTCDTSKPYHGDDACFPLDHQGQAWSLSEVFGRPMKGACPLTDAEVPPVCIQVPHSRDVYTSGGVHEIKRRDVDGERCFMIGDIGSDFEMVLPRMQPPLPPPSEDGQEEPPPLPQKTEADELVPPAQPPLYAERSLTGYGQERGGVQSILTNPSADTEVEFVYMESLPWFMRVYLHTIKVRVESIGDSAASGLAKPSRWQRLGSASPVGANASSSVIQEIYYRPAQDRARGTQLELRIRLPPASTAFLTYDFEKTILRYTEYPPDANRGFDVAAAVITVLDPSTSATGERRAVANLRTTALLLNLPTPDFSMPYNVIIFTSTTIALAFGGMFNIIVRRFVAADEGPELNVRALRKKVVGRLAILGQRVAARWKTRREGGQHEKVE